MGCMVLFFSITPKSGHWLQSTKIRIKCVTNANIFSNSSSELLPETPPQQIHQGESPPTLSRDGAGQTLDHWTNTIHPYFAWGWNPGLGSEALFTEGPLLSAKRVNKGHPRAKPGPPRLSSKRFSPRLRASSSKLNHKFRIKTKGARLVSCGKGWLSVANFRGPQGRTSEGSKTSADWKA